MLVFISPFKKTYFSKLFSLSSLIAFIFLLAAILFPLFAGYATEDFWLRLKEYPIQPIVNYTEHYMLYITNFDNDSNVENYFDSSDPNLNEKFKEICTNGAIIDYDLNNCKEISSDTYFFPSVLNTDSDSKADKLQVIYTINNFDNFNKPYLDLKLMFFVKYALNKKVKLIMTPMIYVNIPLIVDIYNLKGRKIKLIGEIKLNQKSPIATYTITNRAYDYENQQDDEHKNPFIINDYEKEKTPFDFLQYYNKYKNMNLTVKYDYEMEEEITDDKTLELDIEMIVPKLQNVFYIQGIFETIKYAWMQYFYIFLPIYIVLYFCFKFIIRNNIFSAKIKSDLN